MSRWCGWNLTRVPMPIPQPGDVFPTCTPLKIRCSGRTFVIPSFFGNERDKPVCQAHIEQSQMYHAGFLRANNNSPNLSEKEWSQWTEDGIEMDWD